MLLEYKTPVTLPLKYSGVAGSAPTQQTCTEHFILGILLRAARKDGDGALLKGIHNSAGKQNQVSKCVGVKTFHNKASYPCPPPCQFCVSLNEVSHGRPYDGFVCTKEGHQFHGNVKVIHRLTYYMPVLNK